jgi:hypothetical protein
MKSTSDEPAWAGSCRQLPAHPMIRSSETSVNKISTWRHIPEDGILHSHRREDLKSHTVICLLAKTSLTDSALIQAPTFSRRHTKTHSDNNRRHSEKDWHTSTTTQLWNADMPTSSSHTEFLSTAATASTRWRVRELYCQISYGDIIHITVNKTYDIASYMTREICRNL